MSEDNEILFLGTTNLDEELEVGIEAEYMAVVDEIERCRKRNKVLKEKLSKYQEEKIRLLLISETSFKRPRIVRKI